MVDDVVVVVVVVDIVAVVVVFVVVVVVVVVVVGRNQSTLAMFDRFATNYCYCAYYWEFASLSKD